ncbi:alpha/beta hydrolase [Glutamicibacter sp. MNS18]|uniref:alpha/beta hydrolase n=1 Tax=Glutamicibacter sp. MNS18 TaxID=2989817 RepID=UPI0022360936|nr:alpha/beta hydrolase [Glutamicibacter sp. MNS18]MCW4465424.1 alpha/beta hydrolase [Glutamicibacter sp. MNS18]
MSTFRPAPTTRLLEGITYSRPAGKDLLLDLYLPGTGEQPYPVVIWLHGGGWFTGDRTLAPDLALHAGSMQCAIASIEYRLSGTDAFPAQLEDVHQAVRFLRDEAGRFGLDPQRIGLWGASAGGHLAALAALTAEHPVYRNEHPEAEAARVQAVAVSYPPVDLAAIVAQAAGRQRGWEQTPEGRFLGHDPATPLGAELARQANPLSWVTGSAPAFQISHGTGDLLVGPDHSVQLHQALLQADADSELYLLDGFKHGFLNPPGRLDVQLASVMDDGRLQAEEPVAAIHYASGLPGDGAAHTFGFARVHEFFKHRLSTLPTKAKLL